MKSDGIDLGKLQEDFVSARRAWRASATALSRAMVTHDAAREEMEKAKEKLTQASRSVLS